MSCCTECNASFNDLLINCPDSDYSFLTSIYCHQFNKSYVNCQHYSIYTARLSGPKQNRDYFKQYLKVHTLLHHGINSATNISTCNDSSQAPSSTLPNIPQIYFGAFNS